jgi:transposase InsO family protein
MAASLMGIMALVCKNMRNSTLAIHQKPPLTHSPHETISAMVAPRRSSLTRSPVWSLKVPQA